MGRSRKLRFPLTGPLTQPQFEACWDSLPLWRKEQIRQKSADFNLTIKHVLNRWPDLRIAVVPGR